MRRYARLLVLGFALTACGLTLVYPIRVGIGVTAAVASARSEVTMADTTLAHAELDGARGRDTREYEVISARTHDKLTRFQQLSSEMRAQTRLVACIVGSMFALMVALLYFRELRKGLSATGRRARTT